MSNSLVQGTLLPIYNITRVDFVSMQYYTVRHGQNISCTITLKCPDMLNIHIKIIIVLIITGVW